MVILIKILQLILSLSLLVIIHELGHFLFARLFKIRVEKFYLFFNPWFSLFKFKRGDTEYGIGWLPLGGYVKIAGMIDESMDTEQMKQPVQPDEFRAKPTWQRLLVMIGGVLMNVVLAIAIYIGISYTWGETYYDNRDMKYGYVFNDLAREIGFRNGDKIIDVAGVQVNDFQKIYYTMVISQAPYVTVERNGQPVRIDIPESYMPRMLNSPDFMAPRLPYIIKEMTPGGGAAVAGLKPGDSLISFNGESIHFLDQFLTAQALNKGDTARIGFARDSAGITRFMTLPVLVSDKGQLGIWPDDRMIPSRTYKYTFWQSIPEGFKKGGTELRDYFKQLKLIFSPKTEAYKSVGGIMTIGNIFPGTWDWHAFWLRTALLSIMLAVLNILPIPVLDGGHVLFLLYEVVTRRKPSERFLEMAQWVGLVLLLSLLIYANGNDIYRYLIK